MLCSPRVPLQTRTLQRCSCRGSSCCVMINEAMKHDPHLTVPLSTLSTRIGCPPTPTEPSTEQGPAQLTQRNSIQQFSVDNTGDTTLTCPGGCAHVVTCFRWGQLERGPGSRDGAAHPQVLRRGEERPRPGGRAGQEGATVQTSGKSLLVFIGWCRIYLFEWFRTWVISGCFL